MSLKLTTQDKWKDYAFYSRYHPDNTHKPKMKLDDEEIKSPPPILEITELDKQNGMWGHTKCCEQAYGPQESNKRMMKSTITTKVCMPSWSSVTGRCPPFSMHSFPAQQLTWSRRLQIGSKPSTFAEKGQSHMCSAM